MTNTVKVKYVGKKPFAIDNVSGSRKQWHGNGDVQEVTDAQAKVLIKYPDQWALVDLADMARVNAPVSIQSTDEDGDSVAIDPNALSKPLERMSKAELVAYASEKLGQKLDARKSTKGMIDQIEEWLAEGRD